MMHYLSGISFFYSELLHHKLESVSDTSDAELGLITFDNKQPTTRKRKRTNLTGKYSKNEYNH